MKTTKAVENFLKVLDEHNFVDLFYIVEYKTGERRSICFYKREKAERHLEYLQHIEPRNEFYIARTCVYFG